MNFRLRPPIILRNAKLKFQPRRLKKMFKFMVIIEVKMDGNIELESLYSKRTKVVTRKLLQHRAQPP